MQWMEKKPRRWGSDPHIPLLRPRKPRTPPPLPLRRVCDRVRDTAAGLRYADVPMEISRHFRLIVDYVLELFGTRVVPASKRVCVFG